eukprot:1137585-Pelagomonas_calceolata.AAC.8
MYDLCPRAAGESAKAIFWDFHLVLLLRALVATLISKSSALHVLTGLWGNLAGVAPASAIFISVYEPVKRSVEEAVSSDQIYNSNVYMACLKSASLPSLQILMLEINLIKTPVSNKVCFCRASFMGREPPALLASGEVHTRLLLPASADPALKLGMPAKQKHVGSSAMSRGRKGPWAKFPKTLC